MNDAANQPPASCEDDYDLGSLTCAAALQNLLAAVTPLRDSERVNLRAALGRVLPQAISAPAAVPAHPNSAMDGYALNANDVPAQGLVWLRVVGASLAGKPFTGTLGAGEAVRIMTGAVVPAGADTVVLQEQTREVAGEVAIEACHRRGQHVRLPGEDLALGSTVLPAGRRLSPADLGLIASLGIGEVTVVRRVRVAFFSTGDELRSLGEPLGRGDIYDSNRYTLFGMLARLGVDAFDLGVIRDDPAALSAAFTSAAAMADVVITSGGVSVGEADYTKAVLAELGEVRFWKVAMKPGRPLAFGRIGGASFFGLPGNPVSVMVTFYLFVQPTLEKLMGTTPRTAWTLTARTTAALKKRPGRLEFQRGLLALDAQGGLQVTPTGDQGSGILSSMSNANCFIVLDLDTAQVAAHTEVCVQPFDFMG
ncbi:MAG: molybdopterin molybdenumtransferase MoeA [Gammaproteobacteria bacterium]|nr:molybdopterin molybdenumtransferase MoeA [Gammaproteobacteria bacterium]